MTLIAVMFDASQEDEVTMVVFDRDREELVRKLPLGDARDTASPEHLRLHPRHYHGSSNL